MKVALSIVSIMTLVSCTEQGISPSAENNLLMEGAKWELIEIRTGYGDWETVTKDQKHFLYFVTNNKVTYSDRQQNCEGTYFLNELENSSTKESLTLHIPCIVSSPQLWLEHLIEARTDSTIDTYPQINPTALMSVTRYRFRIIPPAHDE